MRTFPSTLTRRWYRMDVTCHPDTGDGREGGYGDGGKVGDVTSVREGAAK